MVSLNTNQLLGLCQSIPRTLQSRKCQSINFSRGAKMWVPAPEKIKVNNDNLGPLLDSLRLIKAIKITQPDLPIELTIEPLMKKTVNLNVLKGRFTLPHPIPPACLKSNENDNKQDVIAVILDEQSNEDVQLAKQLGADHFGGQDLLDKILAGQIKPNKLLVHSKTPKIRNLFMNSESKKNLFKNLSRLNLIIPSEKRGTMSEDLAELIQNSRNSIDWMVKKKEIVEQSQQDPQELDSPSSSTTSNQSKKKVNHKKSNEIDSFISIPVGSVQMNLIDLEENITNFLSMISTITQFGTTTAVTTTALPSKSDQNNSQQLPSKSSFKSGRPIKRPGIYRAMLNVKGIPSITLI